MGFFSDRHSTSITSTIENVTSRDDFAIEEELVHILELIENASTKQEFNNNQAEAARALRKKLKYGNRVQAWRAFEILDLCVSQGTKLGILYNDPKLLSRTKMLTINEGANERGQRYSSKLVKNATCAVLSWYDYLIAQDLDKSPTFEGIFNLSKQVKRKYDKKRAALHLNGGSTRDGPLLEHNESIFSSAQDPDRYDRNPYDLGGIPRIDINKESPKIRLVISDGLATATALKNALMILPRGEKSTDDTESTNKYEEARDIRRKVLRYLQAITEGEHLGSLIECNEQLVEALSEYDRKAKNEAADDVESISAEDSNDESDLIEPREETDDPFTDGHKI